MTASTRRETRPARPAETATAGFVRTTLRPHVADIERRNDRRKAHE